jgi:ribosomal-protein-alanine N-acetyltransferase
MALRHPSRAGTAIRLYGRRVMLRPLVASDFRSWSEVRQHNADWLTVWEPSRPAFQPDPVTDRNAFAARCQQRDRDRSSGTAYQFGLFIDGGDGGFDDQHVVGEVNINNVIRGALQSATIGYWIDQRHAGRSYVAEAVVVVLQFAFEQLMLHRVEICIVPRNHRSRRVMEKLAIRDEGTAERYLEINGTWEDHVRYGITTEEWLERRESLLAAWITRPRDLV